MMDRRDLIAIPVITLVGLVVGSIAELAHWSDGELLFVGSVALIVTGTLLWHFDWSRFSRRASERAKHL